MQLEQLVTSEIMVEQVLMLRSPAMGQEHCKIIILKDKSRGTMAQTN